MQIIVTKYFVNCRCSMNIATQSREAIVVFRIVFIHSNLQMRVLFIIKLSSSVRESTAVSAPLLCRRVYSQTASSFWNPR